MSIMPQDPDSNTSPPPELLHAASEWIWRHSRQPNGDRWLSPRPTLTAADDPNHLDWAAENLLCDLAPWLTSEAEQDERSWQQAVDWHAGYAAGLARGRESRFRARLRRVFGRAA